MLRMICETEMSVKENFVMVVPAGLEPATVP